MIKEHRGRVRTQLARAPQPKKSDKPQNRRNYIWKIEAQVEPSQFTCRVLMAQKEEEAD